MIRPQVVRNWYAFEGSAYYVGCGLQRREVSQGLQAILICNLVFGRKLGAYKVTTIFSDFNWLWMRSQRISLVFFVWNWWILRNQITFIKWEIGHCLYYVEMTISKNHHFFKILMFKVALNHLLGSQWNIQKCVHRMTLFGTAALQNV